METKQCPACKGPLDKNGKCLICGTITELKFSSEDGQILFEVPDELARISEEISKQDFRSDKEYDKLIDTLSETQTGYILTLEKINKCKKRNN